MPASMTKHVAARDLPPRPSGNACAISVSVPTMGRDVTTRLRDITPTALDSGRFFRTYRNAALLACALPPRTRLREVHPRLGDTSRQHRSRTSEREHVMKKLLKVAAGTEVAAGLVLIGDPSFFTRLVFGAEMTAPGQALGRVTGFGLSVLGLVSWPSREALASDARSARAMLRYNVLCAVYFVYRGARGGDAGPLLWPAAGLHGVLATLLARTLFQKP